MEREHEGEVKKGRMRSPLFLLLKFTLIALVIIVPIRYFVARPLIVSGVSMEPNVNKHEYLVVDELTYRFEKPKRGDVVIFRYPLDPDIFYIKRIIGLPGERVRIEEGRVTITNPQGIEHILEEPYVALANADHVSSAVKLTDTEYFVLGDNRQESSDSRTWGPLAERYIMGRALMRLFPFSAITTFPASYSFE